MGTSQTGGVHPATNKCLHPQLLRQPVDTLILRLVNHPLPLHSRMPGIAVRLTNLTLLIGDRHENGKHVNGHKVPGPNANTYQLLHAVLEMRPLTAWHLVVILLADFAAHAGVAKLGAKELGDLQEREGEVGKMVVMHATFVEVMIGGMMIGVAHQNLHGVDILQLRAGPLVDVPVCQQPEGTVVEIPVRAVIEPVDDGPSTIELPKLGRRMGYSPRQKCARY